ncbi:MAG TPA: hypothetical protein VLN90_09530 [Thioalkalivibrio sp.]|nr:hypothetical protein [Thioalkalivibrio sp.]
MPRLIRSLQAWGRPEFEDVLKQEIVALGAEGLPLQQGLSAGSMALAEDLGVMILAITQTTEALTVRAGLFYTSIIAGCACADDPTPTDVLTEYCEVVLAIDRDSGQTRIRLDG